MIFPFEKLPAITQIEKIAQIFDEAEIKHIVWTGSILRLYGVEDTQLGVPHYIEFVVEIASMVRAVQLLYEKSFSRGLNQVCGRSGGFHDVGTEIVQLSTGGAPHLDLYLHTCSKVLGSCVVPEDDDKIWMNEGQWELPRFVLTKLRMLKPVYYIKMHLIQWARRWCLEPEESYHWFMGARILDYLISRKLKPEVIGYESLDHHLDGVWRAVHAREPFKELEVYVQRMAQALDKAGILAPLPTPRWPEKLVRDIYDGDVPEYSAFAGGSMATTFGDSFHPTIANTSVASSVAAPSDPSTPVTEEEPPAPSRAVASTATPDSDNAAVLQVPGTPETEWIAQIGVAEEGDVSGVPGTPEEALVAQAKVIGAVEDPTDPRSSPGSPEATADPEADVAASDPPEDQEAYLVLPANVSFGSLPETVAGSDADPGSPMATEADEPEQYSAGSSMVTEEDVAAPVHDPMELSSAHPSAKNSFRDMETSPGTPKSPDKDRAERIPPSLTSSTDSEPTSSVETEVEVTEAQPSLFAVKDSAVDPTNDDTRDDPTPDDICAQS
ncbi:hypothetical protein ASPACDRAFT_1891035 [Aspergillus aculeatus ATCC 16872]|uniref:Uncharacterized protein n=1 Tax=Aspergillus aculeatus (strain ATCC 16872 / CBS 172.66 / WB 5094) TaxID=690307 RepID=A0A1L9WKJ4_ASPA1|nr:uncharacterized protein ASPACDRAFT_1891035 [Aspergillus aculeatus ATCC 16872]OJJ96676.1 hypothetical protein ASPACDRAFT_1891035 [Aspergillus aculeatus ATCC 16872]